MVSNVLSMKYIFGMNADCGHDLELLQDGKTVLYAAGTNIVKYNMDDKSQDYSNTSVSRTSPTITDLCLNSQRSMLAVARKGARAQIQCLDVVTLKLIRSSMPMTEDQAKLMPDFFALSFSTKEDRIVALSNLAQPVLSLWGMDLQSKSLKVLGILQLNCLVEKVSVHPSKPETICCVGPESFKLIRFYPDKNVEESLKFHVHNIPTRKEQPTDYRCHCWFTSTSFNAIILCTARNIYVLKDDNAEILFQIDNTDPKTAIDLSCVIALSDGFIIGGDALRIQKYKKGPEEKFIPLPATRINQNSSTSEYGLSDARGNYVAGLRIDKDENRLICLTDVRSVYSAILKLDPSNPFRDDSDGNLFSPTFTLAMDPGHSDKVNFMDTCVRKPLLATCSQDRTVKVWDYEKKELVYNMSFSDEAYTVCIHPSGYHIAVSFADKIHFMNLYMKNKDNHQKGFRDLTIKSCKFMKFNHGGDLLAAASGDTPPEITVYRFYDYGSNPILKLKGHTGTIRCFEWAPDDLSIYSCAAHGMIYKWSVRDGERKDISSKKVTVNDMCITQDTSAATSTMPAIYTILLAVDGRESLRELTVGGPQENIVTTEATDPVFGCVVKSTEKKMTFAGVKDPQRDGSIYFYRHPLTSKETSTKFAHTLQGVARMLLTPKDRFLISGGYDGTIVVFEIDDKDARAGAGLVTEFKDYDTNILVDYGETGKMDVEIKRLNDLISNDTGSGTTGMEVAGNSTNDSVKNQNEFTKLQNEYTKKADELQQRLSTLREQREKQLESEKATHKTYLKELDVYSTGNLGEKQDRIKDLERNMNNNDKRFNEKIRRLENDHNMEMEELERSFRNRLAQEEDERRRIEKEIENLIAASQRELETIEKVATEDASKVEKKYLDDQTTFKGKQIKLKNDIQSNQKKIAKAKAKATSLQEQILEKTDTQKKDKRREDELKIQISQLEDKLKDKNSQITKSEKKIYEQKKRTGELEKFKYVLDFKIKELKKDMLPREHEIQRLKNDTTKEDQTLKGMNTASNTLGELVKMLQKEQKTLLEKVATQKSNLVTQNNDINNFKNALSEAIKYIQNYPKLVEQLKKIKTSPKQMNEIDPDIEQEYNNQLKYLDMSSKKLKKNLEKDAEIHKQDNMRIMKHNVELIRDIGKMRTNIRNTSQSAKPDSFAKIGGIKKDQEGFENNIHQQLQRKELNLEKLAKLRQDLSQSLNSKPGHEQELEEAFIGWKNSDNPA